MVVGGVVSLAEEYDSGVRGPGQHRRAREPPTRSGIDPGPCDDAAGRRRGRTGRHAQRAGRKEEQRWEYAKEQTPLLVELFGEILLLPEILQQPELRLDPVEVGLFAAQHVLEEMA